MVLFYIFCLLCYLCIYFLVQDENKTALTWEEDKKREEKSVIGGSWHHKESMKPRQNIRFDPAARNPAYAGGDKASYAELTSLTLHFHPTLSLFASRLLNSK